MLYLIPRLRPDVELSKYIIKLDKFPLNAGDHCIQILNVNSNNQTIVGFDIQSDTDVIVTDITADEIVNQSLSIRVFNPSQVSANVNIEVVLLNRSVPSPGGHHGLWNL